jgi:hypothetical protein
MMVESYVRRRFGPDRGFGEGTSEIKMLRLSADERRALHAEWRKERGPINGGDRAWERWLLGDRNALQLTFYRAAASENPSAVLMTTTHPLVRQAASLLCAEGEVLQTRASATNHDVRGTFEYAVYHWQFLGLRQDAQIVYVVDSDRVDVDMMQLLAEASDSPGGTDTRSLQSDVIGRIESKHFAAWQTRRQAHMEDTAALARFRRESLATSHRARMLTLTEQLEQATNERIQRMRSSQLAQAELDYKRGLDELAAAESAADITVRLLGYGVLEVAPDGRMV